MDIRKSAEIIESGYEFLLAYAAQGRPMGAETGPGPHARPTIEGMAAAMNHITEAFKKSADPFQQIIAEDCRKAAAVIAFILSQEGIGSEIVDNLNASIHLRTVLTDLFIYSEALEPLGTEENLKPSPAVAYDATKTDG